VRLASTSSTAATKTPGKILDSIIRIDHAGELGADRIYAGQMAVLGIGRINILDKNISTCSREQDAVFSDDSIRKRRQDTSRNDHKTHVGAGETASGQV